MQPVVIGDVVWRPTPEVIERARLTKFMTRHRIGGFDELLKRAGRRFNGANRVRNAGAVVPAWWPRSWPITVHGVLLPDEIVSPEEYVRRARAWAAAIRRVLDSAQATAAPC